MGPPLPGGLPAHHRPAVMPAGVDRVGRYIEAIERETRLPNTQTPIVYWRPGCGFCVMLERRLTAAGVDYERRNIWEDAEAAQFVRMANNGNETVPTVVIGTDVFSNPPASLVFEKLGIEPPEGPFTRLLKR